MKTKNLSSCFARREGSDGFCGRNVCEISRRQTARRDGTPADVDREMASLFMIFDESGIDPDAAEETQLVHDANGRLRRRTWAEIQELAERGERYAINGCIYGNLKGLEMNQGERVRWYLFALGSETDFHTAHWHGLRVIESGRQTD